MLFLRLSQTTVWILPIAIDFQELPFFSPTNSYDSHLLPYLSTSNDFHELSMGLSTEENGSFVEVDGIFLEEDG